MQRILTNLNAIALLVILAAELDTNPNSHVQIQKASTAILSIASTQYAISSYIYKDYPKIAEDVRYIDWILTTPLLLFTYWELARSNGYTGSYKPIFSAVILMIALGYLAEKNPQHTYTYFTLSIIPYLYILYEIKNIQTMFSGKDMKDHVDLGNFFIYGWAVYPVAFYAPSQYKYPLYTAGDFINKGLYSLMLYRLL